MPAGYCAMSREMNDATYQLTRRDSNTMSQPQLESQSQQNPLLLVHKLLRGRYVIAVALALVLGVAFAAIGYMALPSEYESTATIRIAPVLPKVLFENEANKMIPMFDSYVQTQVSLMQSRRVIAMAAQSKTWTDAGGDASAESIAEISSSIRVAQPKGSQLVLVTCSAREPNRARAKAKAVVDAYMVIYGETDIAAETQRYQLLEERIASLTRQLNEKNASILGIANEYGSEALGDMYAFEMVRLQTLQTELENAKLELNATKATSGADSDSADAEDPAGQTVEQMAVFDGRMQSLLDERTRLERQIQNMEAKWLHPEKFFEYRTVVEQLASQNAIIEQHAQLLRESAARGAGPMATGSGTGLTPILDPEQLREKIERLQEMFDEAKEKTLTLGRKNVEIASLQEEKRSIQESLTITKQRIDQLRTESSTVMGRVSVLNEAVPPSAPSNARKRLQFAILGGLAGSGIGVGLIMLLGLRNSRIRDIVDAEAVRPRLLGALPEISSELSDPAEVVSIAQYVHHVRMMLQTQLNPGRTPALAITGAASGTGKTSVTLALGLSFAAVGTRTLLIDGDGIGMGLTRSTGAVGRRKLGYVFREYEIISEEESNHALELAQQSGLMIGQSLLQLGYINEADLEEGLALQTQTGLGLADALRGEYFENCVADIGISNLTILPASDPMRAPMNGMSPSNVRALIDGIRRHFDLILIDTGPVPNPSDSSVFAACADGVIMVVSRDDQSAAVRQAFHHLQLLNSPQVGMVFNRAERKDIERSSFTSSVYSRGNQPAGGEGNGRELSVYLEAFPRFGPLPRAVWLSTGQSATHARPSRPESVS
jgi:uncharacterized protein involved in exopolysaccharide biosynthesis/MinD-like ATPase involved in chromosome partitioning or flagellar assembly